MKKNTILIGIGAASILVAYLLFKKKPIAKGGSAVKPVDKVDGASPTAPQEIIFTDSNKPIEQHRPAPIYDEETGMFAYYPTRPPLEEFVYPEISPSLYQQSIEYGQSGLGDRLMINQLM